MNKATTAGGITIMGQPGETDYYLQEAIRNAEELLVLANDFQVSTDIDPERHGAIVSVVDEIRSRTNALLVAIDPEREQEDYDEDDIS